MGNKSSRAATPAEKAVTSMLTRQTSLDKAMFELSSIGHHGLPSNSKAMAFCAHQGILAIGTASGAIKLYGKENLEVLVPPPFSQADQRPITSGVSKMKFTATQRLVVTFADSSIRVYDFSNAPKVLSEVPAR